MTMKTRIIMTVVKDQVLGKYIKFNIKGERKILAEVDRKFGTYVVYGYLSSEIGRRTNKDSAIKFAQDYILGFIPDAEFKWNVMSERIYYN